MSEFDSSSCEINIHDNEIIEERYEDKYKDIDIFKNYTFQMKKFPENNIFLMEDFISHEHCNEIIDIINKYANKEEKWKTGKNVQCDYINLNGLSFFHSVFTTILSKIYLHNLYLDVLKNQIFYFSSSYFIWDTLQIILRKRWKQEWAYLYHHFVCLVMLSQFHYNIDVTLITTILFLGELSNFFNYVVYHMIKSENYSENNILIASILQLIWFAYFRVYKFTGLFVHNIEILYFYNQ